MNNTSVLFICGSLEPGKDGVGDYTRSLVGSLETLGVKGNIIATHDTDVTEIVEEEQWSEGVSVPVLRIPRDTTKEARTASIVSALRQIDPDWVSVQFVPYSFHHKGLPLVFLRQLEVLLSPYRVHLMFHECWIGISSVSPLRHQLVGWLQRQLAKRMVRKLKPKIITTSNELYQEVLRRAKIETEILPLFSNIPLVATGDFFDFSQSIDFPLHLAPKVLAEKYLVVGIFGTIYPQVDLIKELRKLQWSAVDSGREILLIAFGRSGESGGKRLDEVETAFDHVFPVVRLGELRLEEVARIFSILEVSISCTPRQHLGKSGVFAAMRLNDVEVIATIDEQLPEYQQLIPESIERLYERPPAHWSVAWVAESFDKLLFSLSGVK
jgi:hypothetical protein